MSKVDELDLERLSERVGSLEAKMPKTALRDGSEGHLHRPKYNLTAIVAPTVTNDANSGYETGSFWIDTVANKSYVCTTKTVGAAVWQITGGAGAHDPLTIGADLEHSLAAQVLSGTAATTTQPGHAGLATLANVTAGTNTVTIVTPSSLPIQIQDSHYTYAADAGATDDYAITLVPAIAAYVTGQVFHFKANTANTGAATLNVNAKGAKTIKKLHDQDLATNDIEVGQIVTVVYDGTNFQMQSQIAAAGGGGSTPTGTGYRHVTAGVEDAASVAVATAAQINTGTDTSMVMPIDQFVASNRNVRYFLIRVLAPATLHTVSATVGGDLELPFTGTITEIGAYADTAGTTGLATFDVNKNGTTLMTTNKITLDSTEKTSRTAATPPALTTTAVAAGDIITVDIDGIQTTPALGLTIRLGIRMT